MAKKRVKNTILVGAQWGDEGKGKIIDVLSQKSDVIVRYQGGHNAGHTVKFGNQSFVLHLVPSGILQDGKICLISNGVVLDPKAFFEEVDMLISRKIKLKNRLWISEGAHVIMPYHQILDCLKEERATGKNKIGTTKRGIGPCYADKVARLGIRVSDLIDPKIFRERLKGILPEKNAILTKIYGSKPLSLEKLLREYGRYAKRLKPYVVDTKQMLYEAIQKKKRVLFEGAQGTALDIDHGSYPYVTSSNASAGGAITGSGVGPNVIDRVIGIVKAYTTRVGEGPFPTQLSNKMLETIRQKGQEYGATTGRPRRCGWFDLVMARHAVRINGITDLAVMKLDVLDELKTIKICMGYRIGKKQLKTFPWSIEDLRRAQPIYRDVPGWQVDTSRAKSFSDLPKNARQYLKLLEKLLEVPISIVSVGPKRSQTIFRT